MSLCAAGRRPQFIALNYHRVERQPGDSSPRRTRSASLSRWKMFAKTPRSTHLNVGSSQCKPHKLVHDTQFECVMSEIREGGPPFFSLLFFFPTRRAATSYCFGFSDVASSHVPLRFHWTLVSLTGREGRSSQI